MMQIGADHLEKTLAADRELAECHLCIRAAMVRINELEAWIENEVAKP